MNHDIVYAVTLQATKLLKILKIEPYHEQTRVSYLKQIKE